MHKFSAWKNFLKGFFDAWEGRCRIVVTGSASMDAFSRGGDSLMGRYLPFRCHPFTGQLLREDIRDLSRSLELDRIEVLAGILLEQAAGRCNWAALAGRLQASQDSLRRWVALLESLYGIFLVRPWSANIARSLVKEPKIYFTDWSWVADPGARAENLVASQIKACTELWQDRGLGDFGLWYLRDKDGREADFLVSRNGKPWMFCGQGGSPDQTNRLLLKLAAGPPLFKAMHDINKSRIGAIQRQRIEGSEGYVAALRLTRRADWTTMKPIRQGFEATKGTNMNVLTLESVIDKIRRRKDAFERDYGVRRIGVFGSVARNEACETSDVDIVVEMTDPDLFYLVHIKDTLSEDLERPVDIVSLRETMNVNLKKRIMSEAVYA